MTNDQIKGILQVLIPALAAPIAGHYMPADTVTGFDNALVVVVVTLVCTVWSAKTTNTQNGGAK
jgi:hypothetical protein